MPSGPGDKKHLAVLVTNECPDGLHLVVTISSIKEGVEHDKTCELRAGVHSFITQDSYVIYGMLIQMTAAHIQKMVANGYFVEKEKLADEVCDQICDGVERSRFTKRGMGRYYAENCER